MVRSLLNGAFANTAFCIFDPHGKERLSRSGRSPSWLNTGRGKRANDNEIIKSMERIASRFKPTAESDGLVLQDFNTFRQALNVAAADQRLLVFVNAEQKEHKKVEAALQRVFADEKVVGRFHLNFLNLKKDKSWSKVIEGASNKTEIAIIRAGAFGLDGILMDQLSFSDDADKIETAMLRANEKFASVESRKKYSTHVRSGKRKGIYFENEIPYGEDRDGDGKIDKAQRRKRNSRG